MGGWSSKPRQGMGTNLSVPNPLGFFPDHQLDPAFRANSNNPDWDLNPNKDQWPAANQVGVGSFGPGFTPPHGNLLGWSPQAQGILTTVPAAPPPASTNRQSGRQPTPISPPLRDSHPQAMQWNSNTFHQALLDPRVPAGGSSSGTVNPVPTTASPISSIFSRTGDPAPNMESTTSGFLGPLLVLQAGFFLLTRILTIPQSLDSWWTSLNFLGGAPTCPGQNLQSPTSNHSPTSCPPICPGYRWMCLRRFIIFLFILLLCLIFLLVLLDYQGMLPVCPLLPGTSTTSTGPCKTCTIPAQGTSMFPSCCCTKPSDGNCTCIPIPSSWAFARFLWEWASVRFSWLSLLVPFVQWFVGLSPTVWLSVIWMMWYWGPSLYNILNPFLPLLPIFFCLWVYI
nr:large S protein [Hepatitis B virus]UGU37040.1 large S protein [Hepatitis B virus]UGU37082.1 large S protein [Hepatitis B virus]UGU37287.1 large S protein [Hepatitis B virus]UGU37293.1 large S protein [Hepatitis B virus]